MSPALIVSTSSSSLKKSELRKFNKLSDNDVWSMSADAIQETQVPLIHQVILALSKLQDRLQTAVNNPAPGVHPLIRVASHAALKVFDKYVHPFEDASIYWVAL
ncbi:hypothetical protein FRC11_009657, partial [Ceratobasidium sp. 423]